MKDKVSIIIPVYNGSNYLKEAIDSALAQTYKNIEIIVVNDGSTDGGKTSAVAKSYGDKIRYFEKENGGVSTALNYGIEKMTGKYFSWLSHDDRYYPNKVEFQMNSIKDYDENTILYSNCDLIDENSVKFSDFKLNHDLLTKKPDYALLRGAINGITLLIPKKAFDEYGKFDEKLRCTQDYEMWFRMLDKYTFVHQEEIIASSRVHSRQVSVTSPKVLTEGNEFWTRMPIEYPLERKIKYESSEILFYKEMANYLKDTIYQEAYEKISELVEELTKKEKKKLKEKTITVVVVDNKDKEQLEETITSLKQQSFKNITIVIEGQTKIDKFDNIKNKESLSKIKTDYFTILNAGTKVEKNWLEEQILNAIVSNKAVVTSDYTRPNKDSLNDNYRTLLTPLEGTIINTKYNIDYKENEYLYLYEIAKKGGCIQSKNNYLINKIEKYNIDHCKEFLQAIIEDKTSSNYLIANLSYDFACLYSNNENGAQIHMYEHCAEYKELMYSRLFKLFKKYADYKKNKKKN